MAAAAAVSRMVKQFSRLPTAVVPTHYRIRLKPDLVAHTFTGQAVVSLNVKEAVNSLVCNAANLQFQSVKVEWGEGAQQEPAVKLDSDQETLQLSCDTEVTPGPATLTINFTGILNDKMRGFYRTKYTVDGEERYAAVTQFEATDARQAFPCWDEPAVKATFDMEIVGPKDRVVLSNMPELESVEDPEDATCKIVKFATTPIMSTYLVAIVVGEFDYIEDKTEEGIACRVYSPVGKKEQGRFALECAVRSLTFYSKFFNLPYPLAKYDMIAIPDFSSGAMENWGLVLYRESCILVDPANSSQSSKQWVAIVVCHETAHQWFGNLVTMEWWTHLWLNEGFASFMENLTTDALYPEYKIWEQFVPGTLIEALQLDALHSSHPIEVDVGHPSEVDEIFDSISYNKGASVIRMLYDWIGDAAFKTGMHNYLTKYSYGNTLTGQLWAELEAASGLPVESVMRTWTEQMGFPCIKVTSSQEGEDRLLHLSQEKFVGDGAADPSKSRWRVPVSLTTAEGKVTKVMLDSEAEATTVRMASLQSSAWCKLNPGVVGFYRVHYSQQERDLLCQAVRDKALPAVDRLNMLDDLWSLIQAGKAATVEGLRLLDSYKAEESYIVWNNISSVVGTVSTLLADEEFYPAWEQFVLQLFSGVKAGLVWEAAAGEPHLTTLLRSLVISRLGRAGDPEVRQEARRRFDQHCAGTGQISPDLRAAVYTVVASCGREEDYQAMVRLHQQADLHEEKRRIAISGLAGFSTPALLAKALQFAVSDNVRAQDSVHFIGSVAGRRAGRDLAWQFFKDNFKMLSGRYESGFLLSRLVKSCASGFLTEERAREVELYFTEHPLAGSERNVAQAVETVRLNAAWLNRDRQHMEAFFKQVQ